MLAGGFCPLDDGVGLLPPRSQALKSKLPISKKLRIRTCNPRLRRAGVEWVTLVIMNYLQGYVKPIGTQQ